MTVSLTPQQAVLLDFIQRYQADHNGVSPVFVEMQAALGHASKSGVHRLLEGLEERGAIRRLKQRARAIEIVDDRARLIRQFSVAELTAELERKAREGGA